MKQVALAMHEADEARVAVAELAVLRKEAYELKPNWVPKTRELKLGIAENGLVCPPFR